MRVLSTMMRLGFRPSTPRFLAEAPADHVFAGLPSLGSDGAHAVHSRSPLHNDCREITRCETTKAASYRFPV
jgi:hypothetical protein